MYWQCTGSALETEYEIRSLEQERTTATTYPSYQVYSSITSKYLEYRSPHYSLRRKVEVVEELTSTLVRVQAAYQQSQSSSNILLLDLLVQAVASDNIALFSSILGQNNRLK